MSKSKIKLKKKYMK